MSESENFDSAQYVGFHVEQGSQTQKNIGASLKI
jgi:hypothetical protein